MEHEEEEMRICNIAIRNIYIYIIQILSVCVCVCLSSIGGQTAGPIMTKFGTHMRIDLGMVPTSAGLRTGQTGQLPRGLHKKGPPQKHFKKKKYGCIVQCMS